MSPTTGLTLASVRAILRCSEPEVRGGTAPPPLAKTRSGSPRPMPAPITITRRDGKTETISAAQFTKRHGEPKHIKTQKEYRALLAAYRKSGKPKDLNRLRTFAAANGLEQQLDAALQRGAASGPEAAGWR